MQYQNIILKKIIFAVKTRTKQSKTNIIIGNKVLIFFNQWKNGLWLPPPPQTKIISNPGGGALTLLEPTHTVNETSLIST